jgi:photosystem II stability/assembly factor-like uncharacterized protein
MSRLVGLIFIVVAISACQQPDVKISGALEALQLMSDSRAYPYEEAPSNAHYNGFLSIEKNFRAQNTVRSNENEWEAIGPWNTSGRALSLAVNPEDDNVLFVGTASGGLWRSNKMGKDTSWYRIATGYPVLSVSAVTIAPGDSNLMYIGTGEVYNYERSGTGAAHRSTRGTPGMGILRSTDAGKTWEISLDWRFDQNHGVNHIEIATNNDAVAYAATSDGVYKSNDKGESWILVHDVKMAMDVAIHPENEDWVVTGYGNFSSSGKGIYLTKNGGITWRKIGNPLPTIFDGKIKLAFSKNNPNVIYASIGHAFSTGQQGMTWLCRSDDSGETWSVVNQTDYSMWQGWFAHDVAVHHDDADTAMAIGIYIHKTVNGGIDLPQITQNPQVTRGKPPVGKPDGGPLYTHVDHHAVIYHPNDPNIVIIACDGGVFVSEDGGETYESRNGGLQTTQFYNGVSVSALRSDRIIGGLQDNNSVIFDGDLAWTRTFGGDGSWTAMRSDDDNVVFASYQYLNVFKSTDGGSQFLRSLELRLGDNPCFIAPFVMHPEIPDVMYAGSNYIYVSIDGGATWEPTNQSRPLNGNDPAFSMDVANTDPGLVICGLAPLNNSSSVWMTRDFGVNWNRIGEGVFPDRYPTDVSIDPSDEAIAYVTFGGYGTGHVFKTMDYGDTWEDISGLLPDLPVNAVIVDPDYSNHIYIGNDLTVFLSRDGGDTWEVFEEGLPEAILVFDLKIQKETRKLILASHGNGMYRSDLAEPISTSQNQTDQKSERNGLSILGNPVSGSQLILLSESSDLKVTGLKLVNHLGMVVRPAYSIGGDRILVELPSRLSTGSYILIVESGRGSASLPFIYLR